MLDSFVMNVFFGIVLLIVPSHLLSKSDIIDRVVAIVNGEIITLSDIRTEKTMREVLGEPPAKNDRELLDELIDQHVIHAYLAEYPNASPSEAELNRELSHVKDYKGLRSETVREAVREHLRVKRLLSERFGQSAGEKISADTKKWLEHARRMAKIQLFNMQAESKSPPS